MLVATRHENLNPDNLRIVLSGLLLFLGVMMAPVGARAQNRCADLALVLAIDGSGSIDAAEFGLQQQGYAAAFNSPRVQSALTAVGTVDIGVVIWGDTEFPAQVLPLRRLLTVSDAEALSRDIISLSRVVQGNTGIGRGVATALDLLDAPSVCATRLLVNVSGDGLESLSPRPRHHMPLALARQRAVELGVTINGLAIETDDVDLAEWYRNRLITGPDAFVLAAAGFDSFAEAIVQKLVREISPPQLALLDATDRGVAPRTLFPEPQQAGK